ncbi:MAG: hypothetical protein ACKKMW_02025 [Candidatus Nealsonbacteria bacterium]
MNSKDKEESLKTSLSLLPVISIIIGGAISYTIQGIIGVLTQRQIGFTFLNSLDQISVALIAGPMMGIVAGLSYSVIGFLPASLLLKKSKRFQKADKDNYLKNFISGEIIIITSLSILVMLEVLWYIFYPSPGWEIYLKRIWKTLLIFGGFPLIGITVIKGLRKLSMFLKELILTV